MDIRAIVSAEISFNSGGHVQMNFESYWTAFGNSIPKFSQEGLFKKLSKHTANRDQTFCLTTLQQFRLHAFPRTSTCYRF